MIKPFKNVILLYCIGTICLVSCKKDSDNPKDNTLIISPNFLIGITAEDWAKVQPQLKNKRDYLYTEFTQDQGGSVKAAISLPAYDTSNGMKINCDLVLNVGRDNNQVVAVVMNTVDSLSPLSRQQAFSMENYYYTNGLEPLQDTVSTYAFYGDGTGFQAPITVDDAVSKLNSNSNTATLGIMYGVGSYSEYTIVCFKNANDERYTFSFRGFGQ